MRMVLDDAGSAGSQGVALMERCGHCQRNHHYGHFMGAMVNQCWGCQKFEATGLPGFVQADCMSCLARDIAMGPAAKKREADPSELQAEMRRTWPDHEDFKRGRVLVWSWLKKLSVKEMTE